MVSGGEWNSVGSISEERREHQMKRGGMLSPCDAKEQKERIKGGSLDGPV